MTIPTTETTHLIRLIEQQEQAVLDALDRRDELKGRLIELRQREEDRRPYMRTLLELQGAAAVKAAKQILGIG